jgi:hypothetical protein
MKGTTVFVVVSLGLVGLKNEENSCFSKKSHFLRYFFTSSVNINVTFRKMAGTQVTKQKNLTTVLFYLLGK